MKYVSLLLSLVIVVGIGWLSWSQIFRFPTPFIFSHAQSVVQSKDTVKQQQPIILLFGGDIMLDRYIRTTMHRKGSDFVLASPVEKLIQSSDAVIANLEGPITDHLSVSETSVIGEARNYVFTFPPESALWLKQEGIGVVNLGNNHILNFGSDGAKTTEEFLKQAGVQYFGSPVSEERTLIQTIRGVTIGFVNYNQFIGEGKERALADIVLLKPQVDIVILYAHWGKEYTSVLSSIKDLAHEFIDTGADVIIGSHPHIIQEKEVYHGKTIYYSLGNFIFDQYEDPATQHSLLVKLAIDPKTRRTTFTDIPLFLERTGQTKIETVP